jgi:DNA-binding transcriptional LysR family regulator
MMRVSFEQLDAFVTTDAEGSFSAAARKSKKAQSVISTLVSNLEIDLGVELFDRSRRYPRLTDAGQVLISKAKVLLEQRSRFLAAADSMSLAVESRVTLAIAHHIQLANFGDIIEHLNKAFPTVDVEIRSGSVGEIQNSVTEGSVNLGVILEPETTPDMVDFRSLGTLKLVCVCRADGPLREKESVSPEELKIHRQILLEESDNPQMAMLKASPHIWQVSRVAEAIDLLKFGLGWSVLPLYAVDGLIRSGVLKALHLRFEAKDCLERGVDLIWSVEHPMGQATSMLRDSLAENAIIPNIQEP